MRGIGTLYNNWRVSVKFGLSSVRKGQTKSLVFPCIRGSDLTETPVTIENTSPVERERDTHTHREEEKGQRDPAKERNKREVIAKI